MARSQRLETERPWTGIVLCLLVLGLWARSGGGVLAE